MQKTIGILQARMQSTRLPGKMLADIAGHPLLWHVVKRASSSRLLDQVVVATTDHPADDAIVAFCQLEHIAYHRGSENDVLDRFYQTARHHGATTVVRLTGDCPLLDPTVIDLVIQTHQATACDYASNIGYLDSNGNFLGRTFPDGLDAEAFSFETLEKTWHEATVPSEREHVTPYIYKNPSKFKIERVTQETDLSHLRWTVDEPEDLNLIRQLFAELETVQQPFTTQDVLALLKERGELNALNAHLEINEGYRESLHKDSLSTC